MEAIGLQTVMKAMGVYRMAGEAEWGGEDKARCRGGGGSASSFPDWLGPHNVSPPSPQGPPDRRPGGGRVRKGCPKLKGSLPALPRAHLAGQGKQS